MNERLLLAKNLLSIGALPSTDELRGMAIKGCTHLVNVSGASLVSIHGAQALSPFVLREYLFSDLFSQHEIIGDFSQGDASLFEAEFSPQQQLNYLASVNTLNQRLRAYQTVALFCHHGVGRSPAVALGAMRCAWGLTAQEAAAVIRQIRPQAHLSALSLSASSAACMALTSAADAL
jgi:hypothetical protein